MSLHTFEVRWKHTDGQIKYLRLFTRDAKSCKEYLEENHTDTFVEVVSCVQEKDHTSYCPTCNQKTYSNHIG